MDTGKTEIKIVINKIVTIIDLLNNFQSDHKKLLQALLVENNYNDIYNKNLMLSEYHVIDCIGKNQLPNATFIAKQLNMTKGAISKITTKLLEKNLIKGDQLENNKKETYYTLTIQGKKAFEIHKKLHNIENQKFVKVLSKYDKEKLNTINSFLDDLIHEL
jgi:DNA-binding MarR family transcriptional regulator